jgi:hypothetical protein
MAVRVTVIGTDIMDAGHVTTLHRQMPGEAATHGGRPRAAPGGRSEASTAFVVGRNTAPGIDRVALSTIAVSSTRSTMPSSSTTRTSNGAASISTISPGRATVNAPNGPSGCFSQGPPRPG